MFRNYICISRKYKIDECHRVTYSMIKVICEYSADDVIESSSWPLELVISFFHQFELQAVNSPVTCEQIGSSLFTLLRCKLKFTQKLSDYLWSRLRQQYIQVKKHFSLCEQISVTKKVSKVQISSFLTRRMCSL